MKRALMAFLLLLSAQPPAVAIAWNHGYQPELYPYRQPSPLLPLYPSPAQREEQQEERRRRSQQQEERRRQSQQLDEINENLRQMRNFQEERDRRERVYRPRDLPLRWR